MLGPAHAAPRRACWSPGHLIYLARGPSITLRPYAHVTSGRHTDATAPLPAVTSRPVADRRKRRAGRSEIPTCWDCPLSWLAFEFVPVAGQRAGGRRCLSIVRPGR